MMRSFAAALLFLVYAQAVPLVIRSSSSNADAAATVDFVVLLAANKTHPYQVHAVLADMNMTVGHPNVMQVYNNSAFSGFAVKADAQCQDAMSTMDAIHVMEENVVVSSQVIEREDAVWGLERISLGTSGGSPTAPSADYQYNTPNPGQGVNIYVVDTGIYAQNVDFGGRVQGGFPNNASAVDTDGHGTHVAGESLIVCWTDLD